MAKSLEIIQTGISYSLDGPLVVRADVRHDKTKPFERKEFVYPFPVRRCSSSGLEFRGRDGIMSYKEIEDGRLASRLFRAQLALARKAHKIGRRR